MILTVVSVIAIGTAFRFPFELANNTVVSKLLSHEALAIMVVVVTVTFATVANMTLTINRHIANVADVPARNKLRDAAKELKDEIKENAWIIFSCFIALFVLALVSGFQIENTQAMAFIHAAFLMILALQLLALWDVYSTMMGVSEMSLDRRDYEA